MQYKQNTKIIIDKRKLDILIRIGCPDKQLLSLIKSGSFEKTGDSLVDDTLECLIDIKDFSNWGGKRLGAGRKQKNHLENQLENQDGVQVVDKDIDKDIDKDNKKKLVLNKYGELGNVRLTEQDYLRLSKENPLFLDAIEKLDSWLDTKGGEKNKGRNHRAYFKSNSWVWENLRPKQPSFLDEMREKRNRELGL